MESVLWVLGLVCVVIMCLSTFDFGPPSTPEPDTQPPPPPLPQPRNRHGVPTEFISGEWSAVDSTPPETWQ